MLLPLANVNSVCKPGYLNCELKTLGVVSVCTTGLGPGKGKKIADEGSEKLGLRF